MARTLLCVVAASIALPDVWLQSPSSPPPLEGLFTGSDPAAGMSVCVEDGCFTARGSRVAQADSSNVVWELNPDNSLTNVPVDDQGREEDVGIEVMGEFADTLYLRLESGRIAAGLMAVLAHAPVSIWRYTTRYSLSSAGIVALVVLVGSVLVGYVIAGTAKEQR